MNLLPAAPLNKGDLLNYLAESGFDVVTLDHPAFFTVEDGLEFRGQMEGGHTKNLFLKDRKGNYFLLTAQDNSTVNLKTLHKLLGGASKFSFGSAEKMQEYLGVTPGAVTALAVINDRENQVKFAIDSRLLQHEKINCHPLTNEATTTLTVSDLLSFARACDHDPIIVDLDAEV